MATTISFTTASPYSLVGRVSSDTGLADTALRATVLAACAEGPLKEALSRIPDWSALQLALAHVIHVRQVVNRSSTPEPGSLEFLWTLGGLKFNVMANTTFQFEIRLVGSERF
jgi:hypothetical protein